MVYYPGTDWNAYNSLFNAKQAQTWQSITDQWAINAIKNQAYEATRAYYSTPVQSRGLAPDFYSQITAAQNAYSTNQFNSSQQLSQMQAGIRDDWNARFDAWADANVRGTAGLSAGFLNSTISPSGAFVSREGGGRTSSFTFSGQSFGTARGYSGSDTLSNYKGGNLFGPVGAGLGQTPPGSRIGFQATPQGAGGTRVNTTNTATSTSLLGKITSGISSAAKYLGGYGMMVGLGSLADYFGSKTPASPTTGGTPSALNLPKYNANVNLQGLAPSLVAKASQVIQNLQSQGFDAVIGSGTRTSSQQKSIVAQGYSKTLNSPHLPGFAVDIVQKGATRGGWGEPGQLEKSGFLPALGKAAKAVGLEWGGDWKKFYDPAHVQLSQKERALSPNLGYFLGAAERTGVPVKTLLGIAEIESKFNPNARNKDSGAAGLFQILPSVAKEMGVRNAYDPQANIRAGADITAKNISSLTKSLNRSPTEGEIYAAHFLGLGGATKALAANPSTLASSLVSREAVKQNPSIFTKNATIGGVLSTLSSKVGSAPTTQYALVGRDISTTPRTTGATDWAKSLFSTPTTQYAEYVGRGLIPSQPSGSTTTRSEGVGKGLFATAPSYVSKPSQLIPDYGVVYDTGDHILMGQANQPSFSAQVTGRDDLGFRQVKASIPDENVTYGGYTPTPVRSVKQQIPDFGVQYEEKPRSVAQQIPDLGVTYTPKTRDVARLTPDEGVTYHGEIFAQQVGPREASRGRLDSSTPDLRYVKQQQPDEGVAYNTDITPSKFSQAQQTFAVNLGKKAISGAQAEISNLLGTTKQSVTKLAEAITPNLRMTSPTKFSEAQVAFASDFAGKALNWVTDKASNLLGSTKQGAIKLAGAITPNLKWDEPKQSEVKFAGKGIGFSVDKLVASIDTVGFMADVSGSKSTRTAQALRTLGPTEAKFSSSEKATRDIHIPKVASSSISWETSTSTPQTFSLGRSYTEPPASLGNSEGAIPEPLRGTRAKAGHRFFAGSVDPYLGYYLGGKIKITTPGQFKLGKA